MNPYREPPAPLASDRVVFLPPAYGSPRVVGRLFYFVVLLPLAFAVPPLVPLLARGTADWTLLRCVALCVLAAVILTRGRLHGSIVIGARSIRQVGFLRERVTTWEQLAEVLASPTPASPATAAETVGNELERAQLFVRDRSGMLAWTLDAAREGRFADIAERVHAEGRALRRWRWYVPEAVALLVVVLLLSIEPVLDIQRDAAWAKRRAEVADCIASVSGNDATREAFRTLCLSPRDAP